MQYPKAEPFSVLQCGQSMACIYHTCLARNESFKLLFGRVEYWYSLVLETGKGKKRDDQGHRVYAVLPLKSPLEPRPAL